MKGLIQGVVFWTTCSVVFMSGGGRAEEPTPVTSSTDGPSPGRLRELVKAKQDADKEYATATQESWWAQWMSQGGSIATGAGSAFLLAFWLIPDTNENVTARLGTAVMGGCCTVCGITATLGGSLIQNQSYHVEERRQAALRAQAAVNEEAQKY